MNRGATEWLRPLMQMPWWFPFGSVAEVGAEELSRALKNGAAPQLVDVRSRAEWSEGHIRGALNVPVHQLRASLDAGGLDRARPVVAVCLSGHRSVPAVRLLERAGFDAKQLRGGMLAWRRAGLAEARR